MYQLLFNKAIIKTGTENPMQYESNALQYWEIEFEIKEQWKNPIMGWTSGSDTLRSLKRQLRFESLEAAKEFASHYGNRKIIVFPL